MKVGNEAAVGRLRQVVEQVEAEPERLDMIVYVNWCGTSACIAGWLVINEYGKDAVNFQTDEVMTEDGVAPIETAACALLGIEEGGDISTDLFHSYDVEAHEVRRHIETTLEVTL